MLSLDTTELLVLPYGAPPSKGAGPIPGVSEGGLTELMPLKTEKPSLKEQGLEQPPYGLQQIGQKGLSFKKLRHELQ